MDASLTSARQPRSYKCGLRAVSGIFRFWRSVFSAMRLQLSASRSCRERLLAGAISLLV